ncbi:40S ribosomal protein S13 [Tanacetum coccineum]
MVAATRSKAKSPDVSSSTNQVKDATSKELGVSSSSRVKDTTPPKIPAGISFLLAIFLLMLTSSLTCLCYCLTAPVEIPEELYKVITEAASIRGSLRTNKNDKGLKRNLYAKERRIKFLAIYYKSMKELPSSWEYNHKTKISAYVSKPAKQTKKKTKRTIVMLPTINGTLNEEEQKVWMKFETMNKKKAHEFMTFPMKMIQVAVSDPVINLIHGFAVEAFNDSYQKYVKEHRPENIIMAVPVECKYYKLTSEYLFYVTIEASEQGNAGVYEAAVICDRFTGARTLGQFVFKNPATKSVRSTEYEEAVRSTEYEEAWSSDSSGPDDFYKISGMVHRMRATRGCGFDYHNPSSSLHRYVLNDGRKTNRRGKAAP